jgi:hypothetical protein
MMSSSRSSEITEPLDIYCRRRRTKASYLSIAKRMTPDAPAISNGGVIDGIQIEEIDAEGLR